MEPEVDIFCKKENKKKDCSCLWIITGVVTLALFFFVGTITTIWNLIFGTGVFNTKGFLITLGILFIISLISLFCCKKTNKKKNCCF